MKWRCHRESHFEDTLQSRRHFNFVLRQPSSLLKFRSVSFRRLRRFLFFNPKSFLSVKVFSGTANEPLARAICKSIGLELGKITITPFPDGETFVKIEENVRGEDIFIIQPTAPPFGFTFSESSGSPNARVTATACAAKASFRKGESE